MCQCDCGNTTKVATSRLNEGNVKSCGCYSLELSIERIKKVAINNTKEKHYLYNPLLTDEEREDRRDTSDNYKWRKAVYEKDNYKCVKCGVNNHELRAHHIENYKDNPNKRYDIANGVTFCNDCHKKFHKTYGSRNTNLNQLKEFLKENTEVTK